MFELQDRIARLENWIGDYGGNGSICQEVKKLEEPLQSAEFKPILDFVHSEHFKYQQEDETLKEMDLKAKRALVLDGRLLEILKDLNQISDNIDQHQITKVESTIETFGIREMLKEFLEFSVDFKEYYDTVSRELIQLEKRKHCTSKDV